MLDPIDALVVVGAIVAGIGGTLAAINYGLRLADRMSERRGVRVELIGRGLGSCLYPDRTMIHVGFRLFNPQLVGKQVTDVTLWGSGGGYMLRPIHRADGFGPWSDSGALIEIAPKQHVEADFGFAMRDSDRGSGQSVDAVTVNFNDGSEVRLELPEWDL